MIGEWDNPLHDEPGSVPTEAEFLDALLTQHTPSLSDANEFELEERRYNSDVDRFGQPAVDVADLALRTCSCGVRIDGFYEYVDHLRKVLA